MAILYDLKSIKSPSKKEQESPKYAQARLTGKVSTEEIAKEMMQYSSFSSGEVIGLLKDFFRLSATHLGNGQQVMLSDFGSLAPKITSDPIVDEKNVRHADIHLSGIVFRPSKTLMRAVSGPIHRVPNAMRRVPHQEVPIEKRRSLLKAYLQKNGFITRQEYGNLVGLLKGQALNDLNTFHEEGWINFKGSPSHRVYVRRE